MEKAPLILLQWEAFTPYSEIQASLEKIASSKLPSTKTLHLALPYTYLQQANETLSERQLSLGANDMLNSSDESFTGSIAAKSLQQAKASFVLLGKAFSRKSQHDQPQANNLKLQQALKHDIPVFFCFGESTEEAEEGRTAEAILSQLKAAFEGIEPNQLTHIHFVYDTPTVLLNRSEIEQQQRDEAFEICHQQYVSIWGEEIANSLKTLCALHAHLPIASTFFDNSPFAGFYFKMIETDLEWLTATLPPNEPATELS